MKDLLPCPFCGGTDLIVDTDYARDDDIRAYAYHIFCNDCHATGRNQYPIGWCESEEMAIEAWNDRFVPATIPEKDGDRVLVSTNAMFLIYRELDNIGKTKEHIRDLLTPIQMVK
jgi:Lar family restriction alleviation protein